MAALSRPPIPLVTIQTIEHQCIKDNPHNGEVYSIRWLLMALNGDAAKGLVDTKNLMI